MSGINKDPTNPTIVLFGLIFLHSFSLPKNFPMKYPEESVIDMIAIKEKKVKTINNTDIDVGCETICVHSDTPNAVEILQALRKNLSQNNPPKEPKDITEKKMPYIVAD